jgi:hypothetical protein
MVIGTLKNAGLAVFDLQGRTLQRIDYADEDARQNNVDLLYGIDLGGTRRELAVVSDRGLDHLRVFAVDQAGSSASAPLTEVSEPDPPVVFEGDNDISAYGIAAWKGRDGAGYVAISQRHRTTWSCSAWLQHREAPSASSVWSASSCRRRSGSQEGRAGHRVRRRTGSCRRSRAWSRTLGEGCSSPPRRTSACGGSTSAQAGSSREAVRPRPRIRPELRPDAR